MSDIYYDRGRKRVRQTLGTISNYDIEGDFGEVINKMMAEYGHYRQYTEVPHEMVERSGYGGNKYLDGTDKKLVKFDKIYLDWNTTYDDEKELRVIGERDFDAFELGALATEIEQQQEREKEQLRKLREKYPNA